MSKSGGDGVLTPFPLGVASGNISNSFVKGRVLDFFLRVRCDEQEREKKNWDALYKTSAEAMTCCPTAFKAMPVGHYLPETGGYYDIAPVSGVWCQKKNKKK